MSARSRAYPWWSDQPRRATNAHNRKNEEDFKFGWQRIEYMAPETFLSVDTFRALMLPPEFFHKRGGR